MKNKLRKLLGVLLVFGCLAGCTTEGNSSKKPASSSSSNNSSSTIISSLPSNSNSSTSITTPVVKNELPLEAQLFVDNVNKIDIDYLSLGDKSTLDGAVFIYNTLSDTNKALAEVVAAKTILDEAVATYNTLYDEYLIQREAEETGYAFADLVNEIKDLEALVRNDKEIIDNLLLKYETLSEKAKSLNVVIQAKADLDAANDRIAELIELSDEEYAVILFTASVNKLPSVNDLTILDADKVDATVELYNGLSETNKNNSAVLEAKEKLDVLVTRSTELRTIQEHADAFIDMVWSLPSYDNLEWQSASQNALIKAAEDAYIALTDEEKLVTGVSSAFTQLQAVRNAFDSLKQPYDISKISPSISLGGMNSDGNYTSTFTYAAGQDHITILTTQYGIAKEELRNHVRVYLNMYYEAGAVATDPLYRFDITDDYSGYNISKYVEILQQLKAEGNAKAISGHGYNFTVNIESVSDLYASSKYTDFSIGIKINF